MSKIPYDALTLQVAVATMDEEKVKDESLLVKIQELTNCFNDKSTLNKAIAIDNGISVIDLINSPNYTLLKDNYSWEQVNKIVDFLVKEKGWEDKEAWGIIAYGLGLLNE
jgi:hypothetical protein